MIYDSDRTQERKKQLELEAALEKNTQKSTRTFIESLLELGKLSFEDIASATNTSVSFVQKVKQEMTLA